MEYLTSLTNLKELALGRSRVGEADLSFLRMLPSLTQLDLSGARPVPPDMGNKRRRIPPRATGLPSFSAQTVRFDQYSLIIGGQRRFIYSAEFDPWRLPSPSLWLDRLEKIFERYSPRVRLVCEFDDEDHAQTFFALWPTIQRQIGEMAPLFSGALDALPATRHGTVVELVGTLPERQLTTAFSFARLLAPVPHRERYCRRR